MAKFKVGQRVRILWSECWPELAGEQGTILAVNQIGYDKAGNAFDNAYLVAPDCWGGQWAPNPVFCPDMTLARRLCTPSHNLEPLTPPHAKTLTCEDVLGLPDLREFVIIAPGVAA